MKHYYTILLLIIVLLCGFQTTSQAQYVRQWIARYSGDVKAGNDAATAMVADDSGYVYVTGWTTRATTGIDFATLKYSPEGVLLWSAFYANAGSGADKALAIAIDTAENVYVTGSSVGSGLDFATVKYDRNGTQLWAQRYNGTASDEDAPIAIAVNDSLNVYVGGWSKNTGTDFDYTVVKYNSLGVQQWAKTMNGAANGADKPYAMVLRGTSTPDIYITGSSAGSSSGLDYLTVKLSGSTGDTTWTRRYNGNGNGDDVARGLVLSSTSTSADVYITGGSMDTVNGMDYTTIKYSSTGTEDWVMRYNGTANGDDIAYGITFSGSRALVTGKSLQVGAFHDIVTVRYKTDGSEDWASAFNGAGNDEDGGVRLTGSSPYVIGTATGEGTGTDYALVKYNSSGDEEWNVSYNGPANGNDVPVAVVSKSNAVFVTGSSAASGTDFLTIKYVDAEKLKYRSFTQDSLISKAADLKKGNSATVGNVRDTIFSRKYGKIKKGLPGFPGGMVLGNVRSDSATSYGWIRIDKSKTFTSFAPHTSAARGFDTFGTVNFVGEKKNPKLSLYNNHLLGELMMLKLNIAASDAEITPPSFGSIIYDDNDTSNHYNGKTLRQLTILVDNLLTYWKKYPSGSINWPLFDSMLTRVNRAFTGPLGMVSKSPLVISGVTHIDSVSFLDPPNKFAIDIEFENGIVDVPKEIMLEQNYPNPFNPQTTIGFSLLAVGNVTLKVYNLLGQEIATLINNETMQAGRHEIQFDGNKLSSGVYFYRLNVDGKFSETKKFVLMK